MKKKSVASLILTIIILQWACKDKNDSQPQYFFQEPEYSTLTLQASVDTINLPLAEKATNMIASSYSFSSVGKRYLSTYDKITKILTFYSFPEGKIIKSLPLKDWLNRRNKDKASVYVINFDSIFVATTLDITLYDTSSLIKNSFELPPTNNKKRIPEFENQTPGVCQDGILFTSIIPYLDETSVKDYRYWKLMYGFDLNSHKENLYYQYPETYTENIYGYSYQNYGYCINNNGKFVFSFPADTNVYETDFKGYHHAYYAKSNFQSKEIPPVSVEDIKNGKSFFEYSIRDSYSSIYFDPYKKWYLRLVKLKMNDSTAMAKFRIRKKSILVLDSNFKIIGEGYLPEDIDFNSVIFLENGDIYFRFVGDRLPFLRYVKFRYDIQPGTTHLTHK